MQIFLNSEIHESDLLKTALCWFYAQDKKYSHYQLVRQMTQLIEEIYQFKVAKLSIFESIWNAETLN